MLFLHRRNAVVVLALTCGLIFLYSFRHGHIGQSGMPPELSGLPSDPIPVVFPKTFQQHHPQHNEKFLTYLPHSGFHNQRIEFENALLLSAYLNRTLLVPLVYLGDPPVPWLRFEKMYDRLLLQSKYGLEHCVAIGPQEPLPAECLNHKRWTKVPWTFFYDLSKLEQLVPMIFRDELSDEWIEETLNIKRKDIHYLMDVSPYDFRIYDVPESDTPLQRFNARLELAELEAVQSPLIHFGSVFGTYRVLAQTEEHSKLHRLIRSEMIFKNEVLVDTATRIVRQLGGAEQFVGLHIRVSDGIFRRRAAIHVDDMYHKLVDHFTDLTLEQLAYYDSTHDEDRKEDEEYQFNSRIPLGAESTYIPLAVNHSFPEDIKNHLGKQPPPGLKPSCQKPQDSVTARFQKTVVYIATDAPSPRTNPLLRKIFDLFPCTFTLSDFAHELNDLGRIEVVEENVKLEPYLIPMLDAMVSAHGHTFIGTPSSTFSSYIQRQLHPVYTNKPVEVMEVYRPSSTNSLGSPIQNNDSGSL